MLRCPDFENRLVVLEELSVALFAGGTLRFMTEEEMANSIGASAAHAAFALHAPLSF